MINTTSKRRIIVDDDNNPDHPASSLIVDDVVVYHMLSRLSVKSLMRLKCVCKRWKLIIEQDPHFIKSHLNYSETRPGLFVLLPKSAAGGASDYESFILAVLHITGRAANLHAVRKTKLSYREILGHIAGLFCFVDNRAVRIYNVSTMESTPRIKSTVCMNIEKDNGIVEEEPRCYFGFDPTTKKHKALFVWG
ncbi:F-box/LRR-repeat protein At2g40920-like [Papaver somniferum]|uniref:F-box/LRR-repeat protein At2g40920-like n=1 Tax=Papaver somniferum TaxID=3469 RepID=UPI000E70261D|nr:F-box/LRR-repeat protein At2g40920-like [Papaver somniferum]